MMNWPPHRTLKYVINLLFLEFQTTSKDVVSVIHAILDTWNPRTYVEYWVSLNDYIHTDDDCVFKSEEHRKLHQKHPLQVSNAWKHLSLDLFDLSEGWSFGLLHQKHGWGKKWLLFYATHKRTKEIEISSTTGPEYNSHTEEISKFMFWSELTRMLNKFDRF